MVWFKLGQKYLKAVYCHPTYLSYMQSTSCDMPDWMKHNLESRLLGEISVTSDMQMLLLLLLSRFIAQVIDIFPGNLDFSLCFIQPSVSHDVLCIS